MTEVRTRLEHPCSPAERPTEEVSEDYRNSYHPQDLEEVVEVDELSYHHHFQTVPRLMGEDWKEEVGETSLLLFF